MKKKRPKILVIDDSESVLFLLKSILSIHFEVITVENAQKGIEILDESFDTIIVDLMMPGMSGIDFIKYFREVNEFRYIPVIVLTAKQNTEDDIARLFDLGANDYINKPFFSAELIARVRTHSKIKLLTEELIETNRRLIYSASHDDLTKVYNRNAIFDFLENDILRLKRTKSFLSLLMFDVDHFKEINDTYGHLAGDAALCKIISLIKDIVREIDLIGRYGGDEFIIIFPNTRLNTANEIAERILNRINTSDFVINEKSIKLSISIGLAEYNISETIDKFIERVDKALYSAKECGRNCIKLN